MSLASILNNPQRTQSNNAFENVVTTQLTLSQQIADKHLSNIPMPATEARESSRSRWSFSFFSFGGRRTVHHHHHGRPDRSRGKKNMDDGNRVLIGLVGAAIMAVGSFFIGKSIEEHGEVSHNLKSTRTFRDELAFHSENPNRGSLDTIAKATESILKRNLRSLNWGIALKVALVAGAAIAVIGAVVASSGLALVGGGIGLLASCALLMKFGIEYKDRPNKRDAEIIMHPENHVKPHFDQMQTERTQAYNTVPSAPPFYPQEV